MSARELARCLPSWAWIVAGVLGGLLALPWLLALYGRWWDLAFRPGAFLERFMPMVLPG